MELIIHRDTAKIGGSAVEVRSESGSRILIDIGMPLFEENGQKFDFKEYENLSTNSLVERGVLPDIEGLYNQANKQQKIAGVLISHGHLDHYGLFNYIHESISFYLGEATKELIDLTTIFTAREGEMKKYQFFKSGQKFKLADFEITPYLMDHSAFDAYAFLIEADGKRIVYSGDFREHGRKKKVLEYFLHDVNKGIDALILEGTNLGLAKNEPMQEEKIENKLFDLAKSNRPILLYASSQNLDRLVSFYKAAKRAGRIFLIDIYTAHVLDKLKEFAKLPHLSSEFPEIKVFYPYYLTKRMFKEGYSKLMYKFSNYKLSKEDVVKNKNKIMMLFRNSMISDLRIINKYYGGDNLKKAEFVYSMWEGYLEENYMREMKSFIKEEEMSFHKLHSSGHASYSTLKKVVDKLGPKEVVPIHTMSPESYAKLGAEVTRLKNCENYKI